MHTRFRLAAPLLPVLALAACWVGPRCGEGTVEEDGECVATEASDADADTDADTDTDTDTDAETDTDTDTDTDSDADADTDTDTDTDTDPLAEWLDVRTPWVGETASCIDGRSTAVDPSCVETSTRRGELLDFQTDDEVSDATVSVWLDDAPAGAPDGTATCDADGAFSLALPTCTPVTLLAETPPEWEETRPTYTPHRVLEPGDRHTLWSVSEATARLIPALVGAEWRTGGLVTGMVRDCADAPVANAQVVVRAPDGTLPPGASAFYFSDGGGVTLPTDRGSQPASGENGLYGVLNLPAGTWTVEAFGWDGAALVRLGASAITVVADAVHVVDVSAGSDDGVVYPAACLTACER